MKTKWIFAAGMRRSGSTLQYNIAKDILNIAKLSVIREDNLGLSTALFAGHVTWQKFDKLYHDSNGRFDYVLLKTHVFFPEFSMNARAVMKDASNYVVLNIHRDMRDVAASLVDWEVAKRTWSQIVCEEIPAIMCENRSWDSVAPESLHNSRYHTTAKGIPNEVEKISHMLEIQLSNKALKVLSKKNSIGVVKEKIECMKTPWDGTNTLYHKGHIQSGKVGRYMTELTKGQIADVEFIAHDWLVEKGYL